MSDVTATSAQAPAPSAETSSARMIATMGGIGLVSGILIVLTFQLTLPTIERNKAIALERAIFEVVPGAASKSAFAGSGDGLLPLTGETAAPVYYACYDDDGQLVGVAMEASGQGFQDLLRILYGYSPHKRAVIGMKVLESKETPGLGDKIETDAEFRANFDSLRVELETDLSSVVNPIELKKPGKKTDDWQVQAITGATISSRTIATILRESTARTIPVIHRNLETLEGGDR